jgi:signal peptidase
MTTTMSRALRRIAHIAGLVVAMASLTLLLVLGLGPRTGQFQVMTVLTGSMATIAPQGSLVIVRPEHRQDLRVGDVLTYSIPVDDHRVVTHRIVELRQAGASTVVRTKGDANQAIDPWVAELKDQRVWTERFAIPHAGTALAALRSPWVHRLGQLAPLLLSFLFVGSVWRRDPTVDALAA